MTYKLTIGLEIHLKIKSDTKLFCQCANKQNFDEDRPNTDICPVCSGQPGGLPVLSYEPLFQSLRLGKALNCQIQEFSNFDRKSYFYPDLPMGYQITQYYNPTMKNGSVKFFLDNFMEEREIGIFAAQIETDTAKTIHHMEKALIDYNRAATPLVEVVTKPDFHTEDEVVEFLKELQRIAKYNDISDADMEKGQMRVDVNISISKDSDTELGARIEMKNMNSFSAIRRAIAFEYKRQKELLESSNIFEKETRRWDDSAKESFLMRSKEDTLDYRYFPEPDMPPLHFSGKLKSDLELETLIIPHHIIKQMKEEYGFNKEYINALIGDQTTLLYFQDMLKAGFEPKLVAKRLSGPIAAYCKEHFVTIDRLPFDENEFREFLTIAAEGKIMDNQLKIIMNELLTTDKNTATIIKEKGFDAPAFDNALLTDIIKKIISDNPDVVAQYKEGKTSTIAFFIGQVMKATQGKVNPNDAHKRVVEILGQV